MEPGEPTVYSLLSVDGIELPRSLGPGFEIVGGELILNADLSCERIHVARGTTPEGEVIEGAESWPCLWAPRGGGLQLSFDVSGAAFPRVDESEVTRRGDRLTIVFRRHIRCVRAPCPTEWTEEYVRGGR